MARGGPLCLIGDSAPASPTYSSHWAPRPPWPSPGTGVFLEQLKTDPAQYLPDTTADELADDVVRIDLSRPMAQIRAELSRYPIKTRLALSGPMVVARDSPRQDRRPA